MFYAGTLSYFSQYISISTVLGTTQKAQHSLPYAYGTLGYEPNVSTLFGLPRAIEAGGVAVNVRLGWAMQPKDGNYQDWVNLNLHCGILSSWLEAGVPQQMFSTHTNPLTGLSAVTALEIAAAEGQRIYRITAENQQQILPLLNLDPLAVAEVTDGLSAGKEALVHADRIHVNGWAGEGYIILDPKTGAGAYKITGGSNGGWMFFTLGTFFLSFLTFAVMLGGGVLPLLFIGIVTIMAEKSYLDNIGRLLALVDAEKLTLTEAEGTIKLVSLLAIVGNLFSAAKSLKKVSEIDAIAWQAFTALWTFFIRIGVEHGIAA